MALLSSGFVIDDPSEISNTMQQILRGELGLDRTGDFEELEIDIDEEDDDEAIEEEILDDEDTVGEEVAEDEETNADL